MNRLTGADIEAAIGEVTPLIDPRLSEVDWDAVAAALDLGAQEPLRKVRDAAAHLSAILDNPLTPRSRSAVARAQLRDALRGAA